MGNQQIFQSFFLCLLLLLLFNGYTVLYILRVLLSKIYSDLVWYSIFIYYHNIYRGIEKFIPNEHLYFWRCTQEWAKLKLWKTVFKKLIWYALFKQTILKLFKGCLPKTLLSGFLIHCLICKLHKCEIIKWWDVKTSRLTQVFQFMN